MDLAQRHRGFLDLDYVRRSQPGAAKLTDAKLTKALLDPDNPRPLRPNCIFDPAYYAEHADMGDAANPVVRYLAHGADAGAWPNPLFDPLLFRRNAGRAAGEHPSLVAHALAHLDGPLPAFHAFIDVGFMCQTLGRVAGRAFYEELFGGALDPLRPHPLFDVAYLRDQAGPDAEIAGLREAFEWYWRSGQDLATHPLFDVAYYQSQCDPDGLIAHSVYHYLVSAQPASPQPLLDPDFYRRGAIAAGGRAVERALEHFIVTGQAMDVAPSAAFDPVYYRAQSGCGADALQHYVAGGHLGFSPHPLVNALDDRLVSRASGGAVSSVGASVGARLMHSPHQVALSVTPDLDPVFLAQRSTGPAQDAAGLRAEYLAHGYGDEKRPNGLVSMAYLAARLAALGEADDTPLKTYFRQGLHRCQRVLIALEHFDDTASNRVWLEVLRSQLANRALECVVVGGRGGALLQEFFSVAHVWILSGQSKTTGGLAQLRGSGARLALVLEGNRPVASFIEAGSSLVLAEALVELTGIKIALGGAGLARLGAEDAERLAALCDHVICDSAQGQADLNSLFARGAGPTTSVSNASLAAPIGVTGDFATSAAQTRAALGLPQEAVLVVGSGPVDLVNSVDVFGVVAARCLSRAECPAELHFVWHGDAPMFPNTPAFYADYFVQSAGHAGRLQIRSDPDLAQLLGCADIYLKPHREGAELGGVAAAQAAGVPVVISAPPLEGARAAPPEGIVLVEGFDIEGACDALLDLARDPEARQQLGAAGQTCAAKTAGRAGGVVGVIDGLAQALTATGAEVALRADLAIAPQNCVLVVASQKMTEAVLSDQQQKQGRDGALVEVALADLPPSLAGVLTGIEGLAERDRIMWRAGSDGLSREDMAGFGHAVWVSDGLSAEVSELYRLGLGFRAILIRNDKVLAEMTALNPKIAGLMSVFDMAALEGGPQA